MADKLVIDKVFADNLGTAFGGCIRDQSVGFFSRDIPRAAGVSWNPLPFFGREEKTRFRARWAALLQGVGLWAALEAVPELGAEEKLSRKVSSQMQAYTDAVLKGPLLSGLSEEELRDYTLLRQRFLRIGVTKSPEPSKEVFARAFLSAVTGRTPGDVDADRVMKVAEQIGLAFTLFTRLADTCRREPLSYERARKTPTAQKKA